MRIWDLWKFMQNFSDDLEAFRSGNCSDEFFSLFWSNRLLSPVHYYIRIFSFLQFMLVFKVTFCIMFNLSKSYTPRNYSSNLLDFQIRYSTIFIVCTIWVIMESCGASQKNTESIFFSGSILIVMTLPMQ